MKQLPIFVDVTGRPVLLLGTGEAADAKRRMIEAAGGHVTDDPAAARLAFVAIDDETAARAAAGALRTQGLLVNVVDRPALCDFTVPAIVDRSPVIVAIGTGGASATLAKALRERLEALLPAALGELATTLLAARARIAARHTSPADRRRFLDALLSPGGALDPLASGAEPASALDAALAADSAPAGTLVEMSIHSADPDDLTLRQLRVLSRADVIVHDRDVPAAVLARARRDAVRIIGDPGPPREGATVVVKWMRE